MYPGDNNLYIIEKLSYNHFCLYKMEKGKQKHIRCIGDYPGDAHVKIADLFIKDLFGYSIHYKGKLPRRLRKKYVLAQFLSFWIVTGSSIEGFGRDSYSRVKICGLLIRETIQRI